MTNPLIQTKHLSVVYNEGKQNEVRSLWDANVTIYPEEFVIIHGPSGCGKSTLLYAIASLQMPTGGEVFWNGKSLATFSKKEKMHFRRNGIGMVFQAFYLIETLRVMDNVCLPKLFCNVDKTDRENAAASLLARFGIHEQSMRYPSQLSGGQKQRVAIARALINNPDIILADEPVGNLDSESSQVVLEILRELNSKDKKTIIMVTHDQTHLSLADRIIHMKDGRIVQEELFEKKSSVSKIPEKEEYLSPEFLVLARSFQSFPREYAQMILAPFKAKQLMFHLMATVSEEQWIMGECFMRERLNNIIDTEKFADFLDKPLLKGGAGFHRSKALSLTEELDELLSCAQSLRNQHDAESVGREIGRYIKRKFRLQLDETADAVFCKGLQQRSSFAIGRKEVFELLDTPKRSGGVGLYSSTAERIAREIEMLFLLKY